MARPNVTAPDIVAALDEFDLLGRHAFLAKYGFGEARRYFLRRDGTDYDSKAIVGAAHTRRHSVPLTAADFSGGEATVKKLLENLGFDVHVRQPGASDSAVSETSLGAWVIKCNPRMWDLVGHIGSGRRTIESWSVRDNRRSAMMRYGQRVLLWVTNGSELQRGFWGSGWITGEMYAVVDGPEGSDVDYWIDREARNKVQLLAPMELHLWDESVPKTKLVTVPGLQDIEPIHAPQMSNPNWMSIEQLDALEPLLPPWPEIAAPAAEVVTIESSGAGYGDPRTRTVVETRAIQATAEHYRHQGYSVASVEHEKCGWDLTCVAPDGSTARVEVKGVSGPKPSILLTQNEHRSATADVGWVLAIVTYAATNPQVTLYTADQVTASATPYVYRADFSASS